MCMSFDIKFIRRDKVKFCLNLLTSRHARLRALLNGTLISHGTSLPIKR